MIKDNKNIIPVNEGLFGSSVQRPTKGNVRVMIQNEYGRDIGIADISSEDYSYYTENTAVPASSILGDNRMQKFNLGYFDYIKVRPLKGK